ncbi:hypothetical protein [Mycolicibacterium sp. XJ775]
MNVGQLRAAIANLPDHLPVVMQQNNEPHGDYEVLAVTVEQAYPDDLFHHTAPTYGGKVWESPQVWHTHDRERGNTDVVLLGSDKPWMPTIDAELAQPELGSGDQQ